MSDCGSHLAGPDLAVATLDADAKPERRLRKSANKILRLKQVRAPTMVAGGGALASLHAAGTSTHDMRKVQGAAAVPDLREAAIAAREDAVVKREAAVAGREARLTAQELALKAREAAIEKAESDARGAGEPANMVIPLSSSGTSGRGSGLS